MAEADQADEGTWVYAATAARLIGRNRRLVDGLIKAGKIRVRVERGVVEDRRLVQLEELEPYRAQ